MSSTPNLVMMNWNVHGMNSPAKRATICQIASSHHVSMLCLQETKIENWSSAIVRGLGGSRLQGCAVLPAIATSGGIAILWDANALDIRTHAVGAYSITAKVVFPSGDPSSSFWLTTVYGPVDDTMREDFLSELTRAAPPMSEPWIINDDFNTIYEARDKSNLNLNRRIMGRFRAAIDRAGLREIKCKNRKYTWTKAPKPDDGQYRQGFLQP